MQEASQPWACFFGRELECDYGCCYVNVFNCSRACNHNRELSGINNMLTNQDISFFPPPQFLGSGPLWEPKERWLPGQDLQECGYRLGGCPSLWRCDETAGTLVSCPDLCFIKSTSQEPPMAWGFEWSCHLLYSKEVSTQDLRRSAMLYLVTKHMCLLTWLHCLWIHLWTKVTIA